MMKQHRVWGLGLTTWLALSIAYAQQGDGVYEQLQRDVVYVHPTAAKFVDVDKIRATAEKLKPTTLKVLVVPSLGSKWRQGGQEKRGSFARYVMEDKLSLKNGIVIVYTLNGITAYSDTLGDATLAKLNNQAVGKTVKGDFTTPIVWLAENIAANKEVVDTRRTIGFGTIALVAGGGIVAILGIAAATRAAKLGSAKARAQRLRETTLDAISYIDSYTDLIPAGPDREAMLNYRERAFEQYENGRERLERAKKPEEADAAGRIFSAALDDAELGKKHVAAATGGTAVAFTVPPRIDPSAPPVQIDQQRAPMYGKYDDVCFFCSRPGHGDLTPVQMNLDGQRRTVMVCPDDLADMQHGHTPQMRGRYVNNQFVPWYMVGGYNPHSMYGASGWIWDMLAFNALMNMFNPFGSPHMIHNYYGTGWGAGSYNSYDGGYNPNWDGSGGGGPLSQLNQSGDFGGSDFGGGSDWGGGGSDWGGGDFGGGDFGGGDFGGGGDF